MEINHESTSQPISSIFDYSPLPSEPFTAHDEGRQQAETHQKARAEAAQSRLKMGQAELRIQYQIEAAAE